MAKRFSYNPLTDPKPTKMFKGWASRAQRRHFIETPSLHKFLGGNDFYTPRRGHGKVADKIKPLPNRLHVKKRKLR